MINLIIFIFLFNLIKNKKNVNISKNSNNNKNVGGTYISSKKSLFNKKNLILGIIQSYSLNVILPFFKSLIHTNFKNCDVVMFVRNVSLELINYLKSIGVLVYKISKKYKNISVINLRWKMYLDFLKKKKEDYNLVFSSDIRDTIFQKDIFTFYENHKPFLGVAIEDGTLTHKLNKKWIVNFVGVEKHKIIQNERIICVGSIWGTANKFLEFSSLFWENLIANRHSIEQGIANYLFYYNNIFKDCLVKSDNYGPVMTIGLTQSQNIIFDKKDNILNFGGEIAAVIHQYERKCNVMIKVFKKFCPELIQSFKSKKNYSDMPNKRIYNCIQNVNTFNNSTIILYEHIKLDKDYYRNIISILIYFIMIIIICHLKTKINQHQGKI